MFLAYDSEQIATLEVERCVLVLRELLEAADVDAETTLSSVGDVLTDQAFAVEQARGRAFNGSRQGRFDPFASAGASWEERLALARALVTGGGRRGRRVVYLAAADARIRAQPWARHGPIQLFDGPRLRSVFEAILSDPLKLVPAAPEGLPPELDRAARSGDPGALLREAQVGESVVIMRVDLGEGTVRTAVAEAIAASGLLLSAASFVSDNAPGWRLLQSYHVFVDDESAGARWTRDEIRWPLHSGEGALEVIGETLSTQGRDESTDFKALLLSDRSEQVWLRKLLDLARAAEGADDSNAVLLSVRLVEQVALRAGTPWERLASDLAEAVAVAFLKTDLVQSLNHFRNVNMHPTPDQRLVDAKKFDAVSAKLGYYWQDLRFADAVEVLPDSVQVYRRDSLLGRSLGEMDSLFSDADLASRWILAQAADERLRQTRLAVVRNGLTHGRPASEAVIASVVPCAQAGKLGRGSRHAGDRVQGAHKQSVRPNAAEGERVAERIKGGKELGRRTRLAGLALRT